MAGVATVRRSRWRPRLLMVLLGLGAGVLIVECVLRIVLHAPPPADAGIIDPIVGHLPRPGLSLRHPVKGFEINIGEHSTRLTGTSPVSTDRPLTLAAGDSFTFGEDVNDGDAWPAVLQRLIGHRVINGGVPGFGLDQTVLRAEQLAGIYAPDVIIVSFIPDDVIRCETSCYSGHNKPYFEIEESELRLRPMPPAARSTLQQILSRSMTMQVLLPRYLNWEGPQMTVVHRQGEAVACRLMGRLAALGRARQATVLVLAQLQVLDEPPQNRAIKDGVLKCADANGLFTLDLFPVVEGLTAQQRAELFDGHMTVAGNRFVASEIASFLARKVPGVGAAGRP